jgi:hypothetical protein
MTATRSTASEQQETDRGNEPFTFAESGDCVWRLGGKTIRNRRKDGSTKFTDPDKHRAEEAHKECGWKQGEIGEGEAQPPWFCHSARGVPVTERGRVLRNGMSSDGG